MTIPPAETDVCRTPENITCSDKFYDSEKKYHPWLCFGWSTIAPSTKGSMLIISSWEGYFCKYPSKHDIFVQIMFHSVFIFNQSMDYSEFEPFLTLGFSGPSPDQDSIPSFGTFTSCIRDVCVKLLMKVCFLMFILSAWSLWRKFHAFL
jgi:hypothetical protein